MQPSISTILLLALALSVICLPIYLILIACMRLLRVFGTADDTTWAAVANRAVNIAFWFWAVFSLLPPTIFGMLLFLLLKAELSVVLLVVPVLLEIVLLYIPFGLIRQLRPHRRKLNRSRDLLLIACCSILLVLGYGLAFNYSAALFFHAFLHVDLKRAGETNGLPDLEPFHVMF